MKSLHSVAKSGQNRHFLQKSLQFTPDKFTHPHKYCDFNFLQNNYYFCPMKLNEDTKKKLMACVAYLEYLDVVFKEPLSPFNHLICECGEVLGIDRATIAQFVQHHFYDKLGMAFVNKQKELFKEVGLTYCFNQQKVKKEKAKNKVVPKRDRVEPYSSFGKAFKAKFGFGSKGNMPLYQACYSYYRQTGKYLWESSSWSTIKTKFDGVE